MNTDPTPGATPGGPSQGEGSNRLAALLRMLDEQPDDPFCLYGIAQEYLTRGAFGDAIMWFDRTLAADADHAYAYYHKARAQEDAGDITGAVETLRAGLVAARRTVDAKAEGELLSALDLLLP